MTLPATIVVDWKVRTRQFLPKMVDKVLIYSGNGTEVEHLTQNPQIEYSYPSTSTKISHITHQCQLQQLG
jgi:hypothetical protein